MIKKIDHNKMGKADHGWLKTMHHFSFADYYNEEKMNFGNIRVINDDKIAPGSGFPMHPHSNMEIITYVINGELTHGDSMGNERTLKRGGIQYMSAGRGVMHKELNQGDEELRLLQIWISPNIEDQEPEYEDFDLNYQDRFGKDLVISDLMNIKQDIEIKATEFMGVYEIDGIGKHIYGLVVEGELVFNGKALTESDAFVIVDEKANLITKGTAHILYFIQ